MKLKINDDDVEVDASDDTPLLWALRDNLGLTGTKYGCEIAECGACTVHVGVVGVRSCVTPIGALGGKGITTVEGLQGAVADAVRKAWLDLNVVQCGYCQPGQIMAAVALLNQLRDPTDDDIDEAMTGNICRCGTYPRIRAAIYRAAQTLAAS